jgi:hypothetical protein
MLRSLKAARNRSPGMFNRDFLDSAECFTAALILTVSAVTGFAWWLLQ